MAARRMRFGLSIRLLWRCHGSRVAGGMEADEIVAGTAVKRPTSTARATSSGPASTSASKPFGSLSGAAPVLK